jgi:hypothetical protein
MVPPRHAYPRVLGALEDGEDLARCARGMMDYSNTDHKAVLLGGSVQTLA